MLDGAFTSPKIRRLSAILDVPWPHALGLAGLLWRFTAKHAPTGEIGRHGDDDIAISMEWPGPADDLITALVRCRLLDRVPPPARLLVHDWPQHAPRYVAATLKRRGEGFSTLYSDPTAVETVVATTDETTSSSSSSSPSPSSLASSKTLVPLFSQEQEDPPGAVPVAPAAGGSSAGERTPAGIVDAIWNLWVPGRKTGKKNGIASIRRSIKRLVDGGMPPGEAAATIARGTKHDADRYRGQVEKGLIELKFVPMGSTYFTQERWNDGDAEPDIEAVKRDAIGDEIARARSEMG